MANVQKYTCSQLGAMTRHYERVQDEKGEYVKFGNRDIDTSRTHLNYNLAPERNRGQIDFINQRTSEVKCQNRADINVMCSWVVTAPRVPKENAGELGELILNDEETKKFFEESCKFLNDRYGNGSDKNVISAYVHMDETTPHMHYAFVPIVTAEKINKKTNEKTQVEKVSAKIAVSRVDLQSFHVDFDRHMTKVFGRSIGVINEATKEGDRTVIDLKRDSALQEQQRLKGDIESLKSEKSALNGDVRVLENERKALRNNIKPLKVINERMETVKQPKKEDLTLTGAVKRHVYDDLAKEHNKLLRQKHSLLKREKEVEDRASAVSDKETELYKREVKVQKARNVLDEREEKIDGEVERRVNEKLKPVTNIINATCAILNYIARSEHFDNNSFLQGLVSFGKKILANSGYDNLARNVGYSEPYPGIGAEIDKAETSLTQPKAKKNPYRDAR